MEHCGTNPTGSPSTSTRDQSPLRSGKQLTQLKRDCLTVDCGQVVRLARRSSQPDTPVSTKLGWGRGVFQYRKGTAALRLERVLSHDALGLAAVPEPKRVKNFVNELTVKTWNQACSRGKQLSHSTARTFLRKTLLGVRRTRVLEHTDPAIERRAHTARKKVLTTVWP